MENNKVRCSIPGCGNVVERKDALVPSLKTLSSHLKRRVRLDDLTNNVVCPACARAFVALAQEEAKKAGRSFEQLLYKLVVQEAELRRQAEERKAREAAEAEKRKQNVLTSLIGQMFNLKATVKGAEVIALHAVPTTPVEEEPVAAKAPRKRASKKAAG